MEELLSASRLPTNTGTAVPSLRKYRMNTSVCIFDCNGERAESKGFVLPADAYRYARDYTLEHEDCIAEVSSPTSPITLTYQLGVIAYAWRPKKEAASAGQ